MHARRLGSLSLYLSITIAFAIVAHLIVEVFGTRGAIGSLFNPTHASLGLVAVVALTAALVPLGVGCPPSERRRRTALVAAGLPDGGRRATLVVGGALVQAAIAGGTLALEGVLLDPSRFAMALTTGLIAIVCAAALTRAVESEVVRIFAVFAMLAGDSRATLRAERLVAYTPVRTGARHYHLFIPNRPPPVLFAISVH